jgi:hypothetical protein
MEGMNSTMMYFIYCKNFHKCHKAPPAQKIIKAKKERSFFESKVKGND